MRTLVVPTLLAFLAASACGPTDSASSSADAGDEEDEADAAIFDEPDAGGRPDARDRADAAAATADAAPKADAAPGAADAAASPDAPGAPDAGAPDAGGVVGGTIADGTFMLDSFDTGNVVDDCTTSAPWGGNTWGIQGITYSESGTSDIAASRFTVSSNQAYVYGKESAGRSGLVRFIQGDVWGSARCGGTIPWNVFTPVTVGTKAANVKVRVFRDTDNLLNPTKSWVSMAVNLWFTSPNTPTVGNDKLNKKPLLLDFVYYIECGTDYGCNTLTSTEETAVFHYKKKLASAPSKAWQDLDIDVKAALAEAVTKFKLEAAASTMKLYQVEVILTVINGEAASSIDDFSVTVGD